MPQYTQCISIQIVDPWSPRAWLIDNIFSPAFELLGPEENTWECVGSIAIDCPNPLINLFDQASFVPEKLDHRWLLEFAHLTLNDAVNGFQTDRVDNEVGKSGSNQDHT
jgi:hypothetical protein